MFTALVYFSLVTFVYSETKVVSVLWNDTAKTFDIQAGKQNDSVAWAAFTNSINSTGWSFLEVYTNGNFPDSQQAYAAGLAEGYITKALIAMAWTNTVEGTCKKPLTGFCKRLQTFLDINLEWVERQLEKHGKKDPYWHQVGLFMDQSSGLIDGYTGSIKSEPKHSMDIMSLFMFQVGGDVEDLSEALQGQKRSVPLGSGHCSALIKLLPGNKDIYIAQDTWTGFSQMLRVLKKYDFQFNTNEGSADVIPGSVMTFSSYPGVLMSGDDFYVISSGLVAQETTIGNSNSKLWDNVKPIGAVLEGVRNMVANRLATDGKTWTDLFSQYNSGTYNNQWMILDYNKFKAGLSIGDGLLYILEQIPGLIVAKDMTNLLKVQTYWPSYNTPYFEEIFNTSGCPDNVARYGDWFTYDKTPRAQIFRRDQDKVKDVDSMTRLMRYNDFTHDPLSACKCSPPYSGENAISARSDLNPANGTYPFGALGHRLHGGIDMKMTTSELAKSLNMIAISSPAYDNVPPFQWSKSDFEKTAKHVGHPDLWDFKPIKTKWGSRK